MKFIVFLSVIIANQSFASGFDCADAYNEVERKVCSDRSIGEVDLQLNNVYKIAYHNTADKEELKFTQRRWLSDVRGKCKTSECLKSVYESRIQSLKAAAIGGARDKEISFEEIYTKLNIRSFYSSYGQRLKCITKSYLFDLFDRSKVTNKGEWWYLEEGDNFWSISIIDKNNITVANTITSGSYRASSDLFLVYDNKLNEWRSIEADISIDKSCLASTKESPNKSSHSAN